MKVWELMALLSQYQAGKEVVFHLTYHADDRDAVGEETYSIVIKPTGEVLDEDEIGLQIDTIKY